MMPLWPLKVVIALMILVTISHVLLALHIEKWDRYGPGQTFHGRNAIEHCEDQKVDLKITNYWTCVP